MSGTKLRDITKVVKATEEVPIRTTIPDGEDDSATKKGIIYPGFEIQITEEWQGQEIEGNNLWYRDKNGDFYWSGWFGELEDVVTPDSVNGLNQIINYNRLFNGIPNEWRQTGGSGICVAVLDTGINEDHRDFEEAFDHTNYPSEDFTESPKGSDDVRGHGSHIAGLMGARRKNNGIGITGIAPEITLWNLKILEDEFGSAKGPIIEEVYQQIFSAVSPSVVNMSLNISYLEYDDIKQIFDTDEFIQVAAAGNNKTLTRGIMYPAKDKNIVSIGTVDKKFIDENPNPEFDENLDYIMVMEDLWSCGPEEKFYYKEGGSSQAASLLSGLISLISSLDQEANTKDNIISKLDEICVEYKNTDYTNHKLTLIKP